MRRCGTLLALVLVGVLAGCAERPRTSWACREIDGTHPVGAHGNAGSAASTLVVWSVLAGACLATRS